MKICHCWKCASGSEGNFRRGVQKCVCPPLASAPTACQQAQILLHHLKDVFGTLLRSSSLSPLLCHELLETDVYTSCPHFFTSLPVLSRPQSTRAHHSLQQRVRYAGDKEKSLMAKCGDFCPSFALADRTAAEHWAAHPCLELVINPVFAFSLTLRISSCTSNPTFS